jgi:hypothetical protein
MKEYKFHKPHVAVLVPTTFQVMAVAPCEFASLRVVECIHKPSCLVYVGIGIVKFVPSPFPPMPC